jgi:hypothetical protein
MPIRILFFYLYDVRLWSGNGGLLICLPCDDVRFHVFRKIKGMLMELRKSNYGIFLPTDCGSKK